MDPYRWQAQEINEHALDKKRGIFAEPRCGKTFTAAESVRRNIKPGDKPRILVTCPPAVGETWAREFADLGIPTYRLHSSDYGSIIARGDVLRTLKPPFLVIVNPQTLKYFTELLLKLQFDYYIADESHYFSNPTAKASVRYRRLAASIPWVRPMTGTPTSGGLHKFWSQLQPLDPAKWGHTFKSFRERHLIMHGLFTNKVVDYQDEDLLKKMIASSGVFIRREEVFGPDEWVMLKRIIPLPPKAQELYKTLYKDFLIETDEYNVNATHQLTRIMRLQQLACGFVTTDGHELIDVHHAKIDAVAADLEGIIEAGEKAIIFHRYKWETKKYSELVSGMCESFIISGDVDVPERNRLVEKFRTHQGAIVGVVQIQSGGVGISFAEADHVLRTSRSLSFTADAQAIARAFKPGFPRTVTDYEAEGTVDQFVSATLNQGLDVHNVVMTLNLEDMLGTLVQ